MAYVRPVPIQWGLRRHDANKVDWADVDAAVYVLFDGLKSFYVGSTTNYKRRVRQHQTGKGADVTRYWLRTGFQVLEYWKISIPADVVRQRPDCLKHLEDLTRKTMRHKYRNARILGY